MTLAPSCTRASALAVKSLEAPLAPRGAAQHHQPSTCCLPTNRPVPLARAAGVRCCPRVPSPSPRRPQPRHCIPRLGHAGRKQPDFCTSHRTAALSVEAAAHGRMVSPRLSPRMELCPAYPPASPADKSLLTESKGNEVFFPFGASLSIFLSSSLHSTDQLRSLPPRPCLGQAAVPASSSGHPSPALCHPSVRLRATGHQQWRWQ